MATPLTPLEYYRELGRNLTPLEKLTDRAHGLDERVDITNLLLISLLQALRTQAPRESNNPQIQRALREYKLTIPANTPSSRPALLPITIGGEPELARMSGYVDKVQVVLPDGCAGLVHVYATYDGERVWPANKEGDFSGNNEVIEWDNDGLYLASFPDTIILHGWNDDDTFEHTPALRLRVL